MAYQQPQYVNQQPQQIVYVDQNGNPIQPQQQQPQQVVYVDHNGNVIPSPHTQQVPVQQPVKKPSTGIDIMGSVFGNSLKHASNETNSVFGVNSTDKVKGDVKSAGKGFGKEVDGAFGSLFGLVKKKKPAQQAPPQQQQRQQVVYVQQAQQQQPQVVYAQQQQQPMYAQPGQIQYAQPGQVQYVQHK